MIHNFILSILDVITDSEVFSLRRRTVIPISSRIMNTIIGTQHLMVWEGRNGLTCASTRIEKMLARVAATTVDAFDAVAHNQAVFGYNMDSRRSFDLCVFGRRLCMHLAADR